MTLRCAFCRTLNDVDLRRAAERPRCGECGRPMLLDRPVKVEAEDFERTVRRAGVPMLVDFYADWCGPCRMVAPFLDDLAREGTGMLLVVKVDADRAGEVTGALDVRALPTLVAFRGGEEVGRTVGFDSDAIRDVARRATS